MSPNKILSVVQKYKKQLTEANVQSERINTERTFATCTKAELLAHAQYLAHNFSQIDQETQSGKANRHLAAIQMCLSFAGWYTLEELMDHNRP